MKKMLVLVIIGLMVSVFPVNGAPATVLKDISKHWAKAQIEQAVIKGYVSGFPDGTFKPDQPVTRAQFFRMLSDALKLKVEPVKEGQAWYIPYVVAVQSEQYHDYADFSSEYDKELTRTEMVRIIVHAGYLSLFVVEMDDPGLWEMATKAGLIHGSTGGELLPEGLTTRAQAVAVIERVLDVKAGKKLPVDDRAISYAEIEKYGTNMNWMWGVSANPLPMKVDLGSNLDISIDQLLILDMEDPNRPYKDLFPEVMIDTGESADHHYVVAMHFNIKNNNMKEHAQWDLSFKISGSGMNSIFRSSYISTAQKNNTPIKVVPAFLLDKTEQVEGWYLMSIPKSVVDEDAKNKVVYFFDLPHQKRVYLTPQE
jgi:hypothetical protein